MPYITQDERINYQSHIDILRAELEHKPIGHLVYVLSSLLLPVTKLELKRRKYKDHNDILGALESVKLDYYLRVVAPYEDIKIFENGELLEEKTNISKW